MASRLPSSPHDETTPQGDGRGGGSEDGGGRSSPNADSNNNVNIVNSQRKEGEVVCDDSSTVTTTTTTTTPSSTTRQTSAPSLDESPIPQTHSPQSHRPPLLVVSRQRRNHNRRGGPPHDVVSQPLRSSQRDGTATRHTHSSTESLHSDRGQEGGRLREVSTGVSGGQSTGRQYSTESQSDSGEVPWIEADHYFAAGQRSHNNDAFDDVNRTMFHNGGGHEAHNVKEYSRVPVHHTASAAPMGHSHKGTDFVPPTDSRQYGPRHSAWMEDEQRVGTGSRLREWGGRGDMEYMGGVLGGGRVEEEYRRGEVYLNVYDLDNWSAQINRYTRSWNMGAFHAGVAVYGVEYSFGQTLDPIPGVTENIPKTHTAHIFRESVCMGRTFLTAEEVMILIDHMRREWSGDTYHILRKNCINFTDQLCCLLGVGGIPKWIFNLQVSAQRAGEHVETGVAKLYEFDESIGLSAGIKKMGDMWRSNEGVTSGIKSGLSAFTSFAKGMIGSSTDHLDSSEQLVGERQNETRRPVINRDCVGTGVQRENKS